MFRPSFQSPRAPRASTADRGASAWRPAYAHADATGGGHDDGQSSAEAPADAVPQADGHP